MDWMCFLDQYQTLVVGAVGFTGVIITLVTNAWLARAQHGRQVEHDRTVLRISLRAELEAVAESYRNLIKTLDDPESVGPGRGVYYPVDTMSQLYKSTIGRIGLLSANEVKPVLRAYLLIEQLPNRVRVLAQSERPTEAGFLFVPAQNIGPLQQIHRNYLGDVELAIVALQPS